MKKLLIVLATLTPLAGCIVHTTGRGQASSVRDCPPAHHWEGGVCVHNGNGNGNGRDHRR